MKQGRCCTSRRNNRCIQRKKTITINYERVRCEGVKGATADVRLFSCPLVAPAEAKSLRNTKNLQCRKQNFCNQTPSSGERK